MTSVPFFLIFFLSVVIFSAWRGGGPERVTALVYVVAVIASASIGILHMPGAFRAVPIPLLLVDTIMLAVLCLIAIRANRWWIIWTAGCQLVTVLGHVVRLIDPAMIPEGYAFLVKLWSWPMVALLALGTWAHRRRLRQGIIVPDWKPSSARQASPTR